MPQRPLRPMVGSLLPEKAVDDVFDFACEGVDQDRIIVIADPAISSVGRRQAILPRIVDPVIRLVIVGIEVRPDTKSAVIESERIEVKADAEGRPVAIAVAAPVVAIVVAPGIVPAVAGVAIVAATIAAVASVAIVASAIPIVATVRAEPTDVGANGADLAGLRRDSEAA